MDQASNDLLSTTQKKNNNLVQYLELKKTLFKF